MIRALRAGARALALTAVTLGAVALVSMARLARPLLGATRARRAERRVARSWARATAAILGLRIQVLGTPPEGRYLLVSNHLSYVDIIVLMNAVDACFLSKAEVAHWPLIGPVARFAGTLFVDRTRRTDLPRVLAEIESTLDGGRGVVFFPEGTSSPGCELLPFKPSLFEVAARGDLEVACCALHYATPAEERPAEWSVCWWGDMGFGEHIVPLLGLSAIQAEVRFGARRVRGEDRKALCEEARAEVLRVFRPTCHAEALSPVEAP